MLAKRHAIPIYCNRLTAECLAPDMPSFTNWRLFESGATLELGDLRINSFSVPHDAYDPVGFMFYHALGNIGFLTDLGYATKLVVERVRQARALVLEANHDLKLLQEDTKRPWSVKQRILSGTATSPTTRGGGGRGGRHRYHGRSLPRPSQRDCNSPRHARATVGQKLAAVGQPHVRLHDTAPDKPCATLVWD